MRGKIKIKRNIGDELLADIIIRTARSGRTDLNRFVRILEEHNNEWQQRYQFSSIPNVSQTWQRGVWRRGHDESSYHITPTNAAAEAVCSSFLHGYQSQLTVSRLLIIARQSSINDYQSDPVGHRSSSPQKPAIPPKV